MSERMIELQRAKLGLPPAGSSPSTPMNSNAKSPGKGNLRSPQSQTPSQPQTPQQAAATQALAEDEQIQRFIHRMQRRDDSNPMSDASSGPTVPTALSRRMLHRQGVGYLDDTVGAVISASADRFLATVLQQAVACRDQRLKGAELAREAARHRKRHMQHYEADMDDRKRRKEAIEQSKEAGHLELMAKAESLKKGGGSSKDSDDKKKKKKKKPEDSSPTANGKKPGASGQPGRDDDEESYDSIDEEEEYYQEKVGDLKEPQGKNEDEEEDDTLLLKDLVRPLEAWDFHLTGKEALEDPESEDDDENEDADEDDKVDSTAAADDMANDDGVDGKSESAAGDDDEDVKRKAASSPVPTPTS